MSEVFPPQHLLTAPRGGSTAAPDKFCAFVSIDSAVGGRIQSLEFRCRRSLAFGFCQFLAILGISSIYVFLMFAVNSLRVRRRWRSANLIAKVLGNASMPKSIKNHPKSIQNRPKWCPVEAAPSQDHTRKPAQVFCRRHFGATWAILGAILAPAGPQLGPKIKLFGVKVKKKINPKNIKKRC